MTDKEFDKAKKSVYRLFRYRPQSEKEIRDKLGRKDIPSDTIEKTVLYFKNLRLIDDRLFAKGWIASRLNKPVGQQRIRRELREKGISNDIIEEQLEILLSDYDEHEAILPLVKRQIKKYKGIHPLKIRRRLFEYLVRRGFSPSTIYGVLRQVSKYDES